MKKIYMLVMVIITIGILSWCATTSATNNIVDLGNIQYSNTHEKVLTVTINSTQLIDLDYISSDIDRTALYIDNCWFSPLDNETTYIFATKQISVSWWFKNDTKSFIYQDTNTKQLYKVNIDYAEIEIPSDPVMEWINKYNESANSFDELQDVFKETLNELNRTRETLQEKWLIYNQSKDEFENNSILAETLRNELEELNIEYNETEAMWISATANESLYRSYYEHLWDEHEDLEKEHNDLSGVYPWYIIGAIIITAFIIFVYDRWRIWLGYEIPTRKKAKQDTGHSKEAGIADRIAGIKTHLSKKAKNPSNPGTMEDIHRKIDQLESNHDVFQKSTVQDIQNIRDRVGKLEKKVKIVA